MIPPLRRRGTDEQRIRRILKWLRRDNVDMVRKHFPTVYRFVWRASKVTIGEVRIVAHNGKIITIADGAIHHTTITGTVTI